MYNKLLGYVLNEFSTKKYIFLIPVKMPSNFLYTKYLYFLILQICIFL